MLTDHRELLQTSVRLQVVQTDTSILAWALNFVTRSRGYIIEWYSINEGQTTYRQCGNFPIHSQANVGREIVFLFSAHLLNTKPEISENRTTLQCTFNK